MEKDYSEYQRTEYDIYRARRSNRKDVILNYFVNKASFSAEDKTIRIHVDSYNEFDDMQDMINEVEEAEAAREGRPYTPTIPNEDPDQREEDLKDCQKILDHLREKYNLAYLGGYASKMPGEEFLLEKPMINVLSGSCIDLNFGEGILDFIYADFITPLKASLKLQAVMEGIGQLIHEEKVKAGEETQEIAPPEPEKIYSQEQEIVDEFFEYKLTFVRIKDVAYASLYSAICPPVFKGALKDDRKRLMWYGNYLLELQNEFKELIEFCYDEDFHPDILGKLYPSERFALYRDAKDLPMFFDRTEELQISRTIRGGSTMPFGMKSEELIKVLTGVTFKLSEEEKMFAEELGMPESRLAMHLRHPFFMSLKYEFRTIAEILELEFTKMLEQNVRFRKCKRCGKYFIMKGNYDTNYCDRVAEGETRTCQALAALENYKAKIADNKAIPIYNKYYKRYAARVKVRRIKEDEFKKWKYQAMIKRDECSNGVITPEEFTEWMEAAFPNRKSKK